MENLGHIEDPKLKLKTAMGVIARSRRLLNIMKDDVKDAFERLSDTTEWQEHTRLKDLIKTNKDNLSKLESAVRESATEIAEELQDKQPAPGLKIAKQTKFTIDDEAAVIEYCRENYPQLILESVDRTALRAIVTALGKDHGFDGVTLEVHEYGQARIDTDLSPLLDPSPDLSTNQADKREET